MAVVSLGELDLHFDLYDFSEPWKSGRDPIVLLHPLGGDRRMWLYQIPALCEHFPVLAVDLRGHGESGHAAADFTITEMARDVVRLLRSLGVEKVHLVGCSMGGMIAQQFALDYPYATVSLVLANTLCGTPVGFEDLSRATLAGIENRPMAEVARERVSGAFSDNVHPVMRDYFIDRIARNDKSAYERAARAVFAFSARDRLAEINVPVLVIAGDADRATPPPICGELAQGIQGARMVTLAGAGHFSFLERPRQFNQAVLDFLLSLPATGFNHGAAASCS